MTKKTEVVNAEFQIIETKLVPATQETKGVQLFAPDNKEQVIQAFVNAASLSFSATPAQCKKLVKESSKLTIKDKDDKEGYKKVYDKHREFVKVRTGTEKERKVLTDPFNQIKSGIDKVAKDEILSFTEKEEVRLKSLVDQWKEWEQEEADRIAAEAEEALKARVAELEELGIVFDGNFYSVGTVSVDIVTIQNLNEEAFSELKKRTESEGKRIAEEKRISDLHAERRELALPFVAYWTEEEKQMNFGEVDESNFNEFMERIQKAETDFKQKQKDQEDEAAKQVQDRKDLNFERRSFKLEKEGFTINEDKNVFFSNEFGITTISEVSLQNMTEDEWKVAFEKALDAKKEFEAKAKTAEEDKKKADEEKAETEKKESRTKILLNIGFEKTEGGFQAFDHFVGENIAFDSDEDEFLADVKKWTKQNADEKAKRDQEAEKQKEEERLQKLPEIEKASNYINSLLKVEIPALKDEKINEIISDLKNDLKLATEKAIINLEKLK